MIGHLLEYEKVDSIQYNSPSIVLQATSMDEKFKFKFFPTLKLQTSEKSFSPIENTLNTETKGGIDKTSTSILKKQS